MIRSMSALAMLPLVACARGEAPRPAAVEVRVAAARWAGELAAATKAHDARRAAALYAPASSVVVIGEAEVRGRDAIAGGFARLLGAVDDVELTTGRTWLGQGAAVVELVVRGRRGAHALGVVGACVLRFDRDGLVTEQRTYVDLVTLIGQEGALPPGLRARAPARALPDGAAVLVHAGAAAEARNLEVSSRIWAALEAHDADAALAPMTADYVLEDFAAPAPLGRDDTRAMVAGFVTAVPDFAIASLPLHFAAGTDVVSEMIERGTVGEREITLHGLDVRRFRDGRVIAEWQYANSAEVLRQARGLDIAWPP